MLKHLACIMDGNRRWAIQNGLVAWLGHKKGLETVKQVIDFCLTKKISYLSLYTFSLENLQRSKDEQHYLFEVLAQKACKDFEEIKCKNVQIRFIGNRNLFPENIKLMCKQIESGNETEILLHVNFLFCYGGQQDIINATKLIAHKIVQGILSPNDISTEIFEKSLWTSGLPCPDLIIRTGGRRRLSNFLLFQSAYSELYFLDCLWPDLTTKDLELAISYYNDCQKNFGK